jgi:hypothetical protein
MQKIILISTIHKETGKCNTDELYKIISNINLEVVFLEALDDTYSNYDEFIFSAFGIFHKKLEIKVIQMYSGKNSFKYIPVLDSGLPENFEKKYNMLNGSIEFQKMVLNFESLASKKGFQFLNNEESIKLQNEMRMLEENLLSDSDINEIVAQEIDTYENSMIQNIYSYCLSNHFSRAIFMCGVAHRKSIIDKVKNFVVHGDMKPNWVVFEG